LPIRTNPDQNTRWHSTLRTPDTNISSHLPELTQNHTESPGPSIRLSKLSGKMRKHSIAAIGNHTDRDFFFRCAVLGEKEPNEPDR